MVKSREVSFAELIADSDSPLPTPCLCVSFGWLGVVGQGQHGFPPSRNDRVGCGAAVFNSISGAYWGGPAYLSSFPRKRRNSIIYPLNASSASVLLGRRRSCSPMCRIKTVRSVIAANAPCQRLGLPAYPRRLAVWSSGSLGGTDIVASARDFARLILQLRTVAGQIKDPSAQKVPAFVHVMASSVIQRHYLKLKMNGHGLNAREVSHVHARTNQGHKMCPKSSSRPSCECNVPYGSAVHSCANREDEFVLQPVFSAVVMIVTDARADKLHCVYPGLPCAKVIPHAAGLA